MLFGYLEARKMQLTILEVQSHLQYAYMAWAF